MKTLTFSILILINTLQFSIAQTNPNEANQIQINTELEDGIIVLKWESNREVNSSYYLIEKSIDGKTFEIIGTQKAGSSTYQSTAYSFEDVSEEEGSYRISLVFMDGRSISVYSNFQTNQGLAESLVKLK